jgi:adenosylcobinamide-phosphate synthase
MWMLSPWQIILAVALDLLLGDPPGYPHVTKMAGWFSAYYESTFARQMGRTVFSGFIFWAVVVGSMVLAYGAVVIGLKMVSDKAAWIFDVFVLYQCIAARDLHRHVRAVEKPLQEEDLDTARENLAMMVGRDTRNLNESEVSRAVLESVAESSHDGFAAPLFWALLLGAPGALFYRVCNTLDSLVGLRNERYELFGKFSAKVDDVLSYVPARLCAVISLFIYQRHGWGLIRREAKAHPSPNAGWSESAMAYAHGVRLGGTNFYDGEPVEGPVFNPEGRTPEVNDMEVALRWWWRMVAVASGGCVLLAWLREITITLL